MVEKKSPQPRRPLPEDSEELAVNALRAAHLHQILVDIAKTEMMLLALQQPIRQPRGAAEKAERASQYEALSDMDWLTTLELIWKESQMAAPFLAKAGLKPLFVGKPLTSNCLGTMQWLQFIERLDFSCLDLDAFIAASDEETAIEYDREGLSPATPNAFVMRLRRFLDAGDTWGFITRRRLAPNRVEIRGTEKLHLLMLRIYGVWYAAIEPPKPPTKKRSRRKQASKKRRNDPPADA